MIKKLKGILPNQRRLIDMDNPVNWSKCDRDALIKAYESAKPKISANPTGVVIVYGTGGEI
jgi:hypothetical protein